MKQLSDADYVAFRYSSGESASVFDIVRLPDGRLAYIEPGIVGTLGANEEWAQIAVSVRGAQMASFWPSERFVEIRLVRRGLPTLPLPPIDRAERDAESGRSDAIYFLAQVLSQDRASNDRQVRANHLYRQAAMSGHLEAAFVLGFRLFANDGIDYDTDPVLPTNEALSMVDDSCSLHEAVAFVEAVTWLRLAAERSDVRAMLMMSYLSSIGLGVKLDREEAERWEQEANQCASTG